MRSCTADNTRSHRLYKSGSFNRIYFTATAEEVQKLVRRGLVEGQRFIREEYPVPAVLVLATGRMVDSAWKEWAEVQELDRDDEEKMLNGKQKQAAEALKAWISVLTTYTDRDWECIEHLSADQLIKLGQSEE